MLTNPDSLVARLYKVKYFPISCFIQARIGHNPSFIWRSLVTENQLIHKGARWRIGTGHKVSIRKEPWLYKAQLHCFYSASCPFFQELIEDCLHALVGCQNIKHVWKEDMWAGLNNFPSNFAEWWLTLCKLRSRERVYEGAVLCWTI